MKRLAVLCIVTSLLAISCDNEVGFGDKPEIEFVDIQPKRAVQFVDSIVITISFKDGDGDLGIDDNSDKSLFVVDNRPWIPEGQEEQTFNLPFLTPDTKNPAIQGNITFQLQPTVIQPGSGLAEEATTFDIYIVDRSDNESNRITTDTILVVTE